jgi:hypothetical protein
MVIAQRSQALSTAVSLFHNSPLLGPLVRPAGEPSPLWPAPCLEAIFEPSNFGKNCGKRLADLSELLLDLRTVGTKERILGEFIGQSHREGQLIPCAQRFNFLGASLEGLVAGLEGERERGIVLGVFVAAIDDCLAWQRHQFLQRIPHHIGAAFNQPAAPEREQRVSDKSHPNIRQMIGHMAKRMPGRLENCDAVAAEDHQVAFCDFIINGRNKAGFLAGGDDATPCLGFQILVTGRVVTMMMGGENMGEPPALIFQCSADLSRIGCIDRGSQLAFGIMDQDAEIVASAEELMDLKSGHAAFTPQLLNAPLGHR